MDRRYVVDDVKRLGEDDMIREEVTNEHAKRLNDWASVEWNRCMALRAAFENHAITYLLTGNGGGAATVIAFAGSAAYATSLVYWSLALFIAGLLFCGLGISIALTRMSWLSRELSREQDLFNKNKIGYLQFHHNHSERFKKKTGGTLVGYLSFGCFILGMLLSVSTFNAFIAEKQRKAEKETADELRKKNEAAKTTIPPAVLEPLVTPVSAQPAKGLKE